MKIGINSFGCNHGRSGIGSYILSIVKNLPKTDCEIQLFGHELDKYTYTSGIDISFDSISISDSKVSEKFWHLKDFNSFIKRKKYDAVLYPTGIDLLPPIFTVPSILVIQRLLSVDLNPLRRMAIKRALNNAKGIISPTEFIKNDLIKLGVEESKIQVINNGIDTDLFKIEKNENEDAVLVQPFSIRKPYIVYASRMSHAKKNHIELIKAFSKFKKEFGSKHRLVIAGSDGDNTEAIHKAVIESGFSSDILLTGYFPHESLAQMYASADLCIFPSSIEGVGLPVIEAMACGIPVACARAGALPEVAGDAAMYFNPSSIEEISDSISKLVDFSENLERRNNLITEALKWVKKYNWKNTAEKTINYVKTIIFE